MRLLYVHNMPVFEGQANAVQVLHMCRAFAALGIEVTLAVPDVDRPLNVIRNRLAEILGEQPDFKLQTYKKWALFGKFVTAGSYLAMRHFMKINRQVFDVSIVRQSTFADAAIRAGIPVIYEAHGNTLNNGSAILNWWMTRQLVRNSRHTLFLGMISITDIVARHWKSAGIPANKLTVRPDGVAVDWFTSDADSLTLRQKLGLPTDRKLVVYAGSLEKERNIGVIFELARQLPDVVFAIVGRPVNGPGPEMPNVFKTGYLPHFQVRDYLFAADALLMVWSRNVVTIDGCSPLKMFEYMATGKPIAGHGFPAILEVLTDRETAFLADPDSDQQLLAALQEALFSADSATVGRRAREIARQQYTWQGRASKIATFFQLNNKAGGQSLTRHAYRK